MLSIAGSNSGVRIASPHTVIRGNERLSAAAFLVLDYGPGLVWIEVCDRNTIPAVVEDGGGIAWLLPRQPSNQDALRLFAGLLKHLHAEWQTPSSQQTLIDEYCQATFRQ